MSIPGEPLQALAWLCGMILAFLLLSWLDGGMKR